MVDFFYQRTKQPSVWLTVAAVAVLCAMPLNVASLLVASPYLSLSMRALSVAFNPACGQNTAQMAVVPPQLRGTTSKSTRNPPKA